MNVNSIGQSSKSFFNTANSDNSIYARYGEPTYQKSMDLDEDGQITFDEFRQYCKDNGLSSDEIEKLLEARAMWKMLQESKEKREEIQDQKEAQKDNIYSKNDDSSDNQIADFDEYMEYCKEHAKEEMSNKIEDAYSLKEIKEENIKVESRA